jgi:hypothetical protein
MAIRCSIGATAPSDIHPLDAAALDATVAATPQIDAVTAPLRDLESMRDKIGNARARSVRSAFPGRSQDVNACSRRSFASGLVIHAD